MPTTLTKVIQVSHVKSGFSLKGNTSLSTAEGDADSNALNKLVTVTTEAKPLELPADFIVDQVALQNTSAVAAEVVEIGFGKDQFPLRLAAGDMMSVSLASGLSAPSEDLDYTVTYLKLPYSSGSRDANDPYSIMGKWFTIHDSEGPIKVVFGRDDNYIEADPSINAPRILTVKPTYPGGYVNASYLLFPWCLTPLAARLRRISTVKRGVEVFSFDVTEAAYPNLEGAPRMLRIINKVAGARPPVDIVTGGLLRLGVVAKTRASVAAVVSEGVVTDFTIIDDGAGYTKAPAVRIVGGGGTGATATAVVQVGASVVGHIQVTNQGSAYTGTPAVSITGGGGVGATAHAVMGGGKVIGINVDLPGTSFESIPTVSIAGDRTLNDAQFQANINEQMAVESITVVDTGSGYADGTINLEISYPADTKELTARLLTAGDFVIDAEIISGGFGFSNATNVPYSSGFEAAWNTQLRGWGVNEIVPYNVTVGLGTHGGALTNATPVLDYIARALASAPALYINPPNGGLIVREIWARTSSKLGGGLGSIVYTDSRGLSGLALSDWMVVGVGYNAVPTVTISPAPASGTPAVITAVRAANGDITLSLTSGGSGYDPYIPCTVTISQPERRQATGNLVVSGGRVTGVSFTDAGAGYAVSKCNAYFTLPIVVKPTFNITTTDGVVTGITMTSAGANYELQQVGGLKITVQPTQVLESATAVAQVQDGAVIGVTMTRGGQGFRTPPSVKCVASHAPPASAVAHIQVTEGKLVNVVLGEGGSGYTSPPTVIIEDDDGPVSVAAPLFLRSRSGSPKVKMLATSYIDV